MAVPNTITESALHQSLTGAGQRVERIEAGQGGSIVIMPHGGRIIGLFGRESEHNFLWTHRALESAASAQTFFASDAWTNSGGDRTWLAPELDHFFPAYPDTGTYYQPRQLDPGNFQVTTPAETGRCHLEDRFEIRSGRSDRTNSIKLSKTITAADNPLGAAMSQDLDYAGYQLVTSLELLTCEATYEINLWNLLQLPHGGQMIVSTFVRTEPTVFFGEIPGGAIETSQHSIRYTMDAPGEQKIGVKAIACVGRAGYRYACGGESALLVRNFNVHPSATYPDAPVTDESDMDHAFQACNISNSKFGHYAELEYHAPAIGGSTGIFTSHDVSEVWAFRGPDSAIEEVMRTLLLA